MDEMMRLGSQAGTVAMTPQLQRDMRTFDMLRQGQLNLVRTGSGGVAFVRK
jgi:hypothetical protein